MWFASGLVMHFVPYPALEEGERIAGLASFRPQAVSVNPSDALKALEVRSVRRTAPCDGGRFSGVYRPAQ